jgi:hypothetical protein
MSRLSRADAAKSVIAVWRWLHEQPDAPNIDGNADELLAKLPAHVGNVSHESGTAITQRLTLMEHLGLVKRESRHEVQEGVEGRSYPRYKATTTLIERDVEKGARIIARHFATGGYLKPGRTKRRMNGVTEPERRVDTERVAIQTDEKERPVAAIVGPDAPTLGEGLRDTFVAMQANEKDESAAFVAAARQYSSRQDFVIAKLREMEALGIQLDREKVLRGVKLQRDDELEGVVKVLPYIDQLEGRLKQADGWRDDMLSAKRELRLAQDAKNAVERELRLQQEANKRLSEKMARDVATGTVKPQVLVGG